MIDVIVGPKRASFDPPSDAVRGAVDWLLSERQSYVPRHLRRHWDGVYRFAYLSPKRRVVFSSGFVLPVVDRLCDFDDVRVLVLRDGREARRLLFRRGTRLGLVTESKKIAYDQAYRYAPLLDSPGDVPRDLGTKTLRDYQHGAVLRALGFPTGVIWAPTGSGKTLIVAALLEALGRFPAVVLTHRQDLFHQLRTMLGEVFGRDVGGLGVGIEDVRPVTVATVQTLAARADEFGSIFSNTRVLVLDEAHLMNGPTWYTIARAFAAPRRYGVSATPWSSEDRIRNIRLMSVTGPTVYIVKPTSLIAVGQLAKPEIFFIVMPEVVRMDGADWRTAYDHLIVKNRMRNEIIARLARWHVDHGDRVLVPATRLMHVDLLREAIGSDVAVAVSGRMPADVRKRIFRAYRRGEIRCLVGTVLDVGLDLPEANVLINAAAGNSDQQTIQKLGRVLRPKRGTNTVAVYDFHDTGSSYVERWSRHRERTYRREGYSVRSVDVAAVRRLL